MTECEKGRTDSRQMSEADDAGWPGENAVYQAAYIARHDENSREGEGTRSSLNWNWSKAVRQVEAHQWQHPRDKDVCCIMTASRTVAMLLVADCCF